MRTDEGGIRAAAKNPLVVGYYGMQNVGDNAFCVVLDRALTEYWGAERPIFAAPPIVDLPADRTRIDAKWYQDEHGLKNRVGSLLSRASLLREASMVLFGGGSVFREMGPLSEKRLYSLVSRASSRPLAAVGVSIGPFLDPASRKRLTEVIKTIDYIGVRDQASVELLRQAGYTGQLVAAGDLAGLLPEALGEELPPIARPAHGVRPRLGVTLLGIDYEAAGREAQQREDVLIEGVREFVRKEAADVTIFVFNTHPVHGDVRVSERLRQALEGLCDVRVVTAADGVRATWQAMKDCHVGLHMRLHGAIFSYVAGVPFLLVPYQPKCEHLLDELGQPAQLRLGRVPDRPDAVVAALAASLDAGRLPALAREEFAHRARLNFTAAPWAVRRS